MQDKLSEKELVALVATKSGYFKHEVQDIIDAFKSVLKNEFLKAAGTGIRLTDLVEIAAEYKPPNKRWSNLNNKEVEVPAKLKIKIKPIGVFSRVTNNFN